MRRMQSNNEFPYELKMRIFEDVDHNHFKYFDEFLWIRCSLYRTLSPFSFYNPYIPSFCVYIRFSVSSVDIENMLVMVPPFCIIVHNVHYVPFPYMVFTT